MRAWLTTAFVGLVLMTSMALSLTANAQIITDRACSGVKESSLCSDRNGRADTGLLYGPNGILAKVANLLLGIVGVAAVVMVIVGGIQYSLSGGDSAKVNKAKNLIIYALAGVVIAVMARSIILFVVDRVA